MCSASICRDFCFRECSTWIWSASLWIELNTLVWIYIYFLSVVIINRLVLLFNPYIHPLFVSPNPALLSIMVIKHRNLGTLPILLGYFSIICFYCGCTFLSWSTCYRQHPPGSATRCCALSSLAFSWWLYRSGVWIISEASKCLCFSFVCGTSSSSIVCLDLWRCGLYFFPKKLEGAEALSKSFGQ